MANEKSVKDILEIIRRRQSKSARPQILALFPYLNKKYPKSSNKPKS